ncbi:MAG: DNA mismatch repair protein MutS, partial [Phycisphaeraceae bacterium]|nr:DNA mismatch repair protein MutS [Phycisphaeraceae bacterium]
GFYIEVTASQKDKAPERWTRKQTLKNAERFITSPLKEYEGKALTAEERANARELEMFNHLCAQAQMQLPHLHAFAQIVADLDVLACFAHRAVRYRYVRPEIVDEPILEIINGRHPVLDQILGDQFVPNDVNLGGEATLAFITGPNMAGKSTYIRQTALLTLLAHTGSFVPAQKATIGLCDRIFTRIGASDELHTGQSTFMVEMTETANICHHATPKSLVILDEIGRGTSTLDGLSLAWAIAEHLASCHCRTLFATHYHEITHLAERFDNVTNLKVTVREWQDQIVFLHRIVQGATDRSFGTHVAKIAGIPSQVIQRANELLGELAVSHAAPSMEGVSKPKSRGDDPQMSLFTEYIEHPAMVKLRQSDVVNMTPMQAMDLLHQLQAELEQ